MGRFRVSLRHDVIPILDTFQKRHSVTTRRGLLRVGTRANFSCAAQQHVEFVSTTNLEEVHSLTPEEDKFDHHLEYLSRNLPLTTAASIESLYDQYRQEAGTVIDRVVPYEQQPHASKRTETQHRFAASGEGDGVVLVVHAIVDSETTKVLKTCVCSGFVVDASVLDEGQGDTLVTCAHTLEEMNRYWNTAPPQIKSIGRTHSFVVPSSGPPRPVAQLLSSMPRSDAIVLETKCPSASSRLRALPLTPFPVYPGTPVLTHLFGAAYPPKVQRSVARTRATATKFKSEDVEKPVHWLSGHAWRRWGAGIMLGYRSYTGLELEAGISSVLPHILTSILPSPGSSGGPLVNAENGCVVGMISGRRMDNRVEGERGWGCSSETIFEMFSLPGFKPSNEQKHPLP